MSWGATRGLIDEIVLLQVHQRLLQRLFHRLFREGGRGGGGTKGGGCGGVGWGGGREGGAIRCGGQQGRGWMKADSIETFCWLAKLHLQMLQCQPAHDMHHPTCIEEQQTFSRFRSRSSFLSRLLQAFTCSRWSLRVASFSSFSTVRCTISFTRSSSRC